MDVGRYVALVDDRVQSSNGYMLRVSRQMACGKGTEEVQTSDEKQTKS
jgi:hypothetical protein